MTTIYEKPGYITVSHNARRNYVLFKWTNFVVTMDEIQELHAAALQFAKKQRCVHYIADTSRVANALPPDVVKWWGEVWVPKLAEYGLKAIVTVVPAKALAQLSTKRWQSYIGESIAQANVGSIAAAEALLSSH